MISKIMFLNALWTSIVILSNISIGGILQGQTLVLLMKAYVGEQNFSIR